MSDAYKTSQTIGGNLITASPISDLNPIFLAVGCTAKLISAGNITVTSLKQLFVLQSNKSILSNLRRKLKNR